MAHDKFRELEDSLVHRIEGWVESQPELAKLSDVARRNIANSGAWGGLAALTKDELRQAGLLTE